MHHYAFIRKNMPKGREYKSIINRQSAENKEICKKLLHIYSIGGTISTSKNKSGPCRRTKSEDFLQWIRRTLKK